MRTDKPKGMPIKRLISILLFLGTSISSASANSGAQSAAEQLAKRLRNEESVSFYFVSKTGTYKLRGDRFKNEASIKIFRRCGSNCHNFMSDVIAHLKSAIPTACSEGQENLAIETSGGAEIVYSHSGRSIELNNQCFFTKKSTIVSLKTQDFCSTNSDAGRPVA